MKYKIRETGVILEDLGAEDYISPTGWNISKVGIKELGLTLEPIKDEPKKLYAYKYRREIFFSDEILEDSERAPSLDILYPKEQV